MYESVGGPPSLFAKSPHSPSKNGFKIKLLSATDTDSTSFQKHFKPDKKIVFSLWFAHNQHTLH